MLGLGFLSISNAGVSVDITIPLPGLVIPSTPEMVVIPGTYMYYPSDVETDIFSITGTGTALSRPVVHISRVKRTMGRHLHRENAQPLPSMPPHFRRIAHQYERLPYGAIRKNWRA
jgi:hypothetical protein